MNELVRLLAGQGFAALLGWAALSVAFISGRKLLAAAEKLALAYVIGMGCIALYLMSFYLTRMSFGAKNVFLPLAMAAAALTCLYAICRKLLLGKIAGGERTGTKPEGGYSRLGIFLFAGIAFEIFHSFFRALIKPEESFDGIASFAIKTKIFFMANCIPADFFSGIGQKFPHPDYPYMIPLQELFACISMGSYNDLLMKIVVPLNFAAFLVLFYFGIKALTNRTSALLATFLMASMNELNRFSTVGYTDIHFALYLVTAFLYWCRACLGERIEIRYLLVSGVLSAFCCFTKDIGVIAPVMLFALTVMLAVQKRSAKKGLLMYSVYLLPFIAALLPWVMTKFTAGLHQPFITKDALTVQLVLRRITPILYEFQRLIFNLKQWNLLWPVFIILWIANYKLWFSERFRYLNVYIALTGLAYLAFYLTVSVAVYGDYEAYAQSLRAGMNRHLISLAPLAIIWLAFTFEDLCK